MRTTTTDEGEDDIMNPIYELTDHAHSEEELAPWLDACGTGRETIDGLLLTALDCAWGNWKAAAKPPMHPYANPAYLRACPLRHPPRRRPRTGRETGRRRNHWSGKPQRPDPLTRIRRRGIEPQRRSAPKPPEPTQAAHARQKPRPRREQRTLRFASGQARQRNMPRHAWRGGAGKRSGAQARRRRKNFLAAVRLKPLDHNRLHVRATQYRTDVRRARGRSDG